MFCHEAYVSVSYDHQINYRSAPWTTLTSCSVRSESVTFSVRSEFSFNTAFRWTAVFKAPKTWARVVILAVSKWRRTSFTERVSGADVRTRGNPSEFIYHFIQKYKLCLIKWNLVVQMESKSLPLLIKQTFLQELGMDGVFCMGFVLNSNAV
jgi:hypothetical protein